MPVKALEKAMTWAPTQKASDVGQSLGKGYDVQSLGKGDDVDYWLDKRQVVPVKGLEKATMWATALTKGRSWAAALEKATTRATALTKGR